MTGAAWALRRLRAMTAGEVAGRARAAWRDRFAPPRWARASAEEAFGLLFAGSPDQALEKSRLPSLVRVPEHPDPELFAGTRAAARALGAGRWRLFGREVEIADPPAWRRHPWSGQEWPDTPAAALDYRRGGAKHVWELGRLTFLPTLALASRWEGPSPAERAVRWLDDWTACNPHGRGIHHTSGIEMALRVITVTWTLALLGQRARAVRLGPCLGLLAQQALHCRDHLSVGSSANNHLLAEYAALAVMGAAWPTLRGADALLAQGLEGLERETPRQIHEDGVTAEQAFGYLPFVWELLLPALIAAERAGRTSSETLRARLGASLEFARAVRRPAGAWPNVGDEDDGRVLLADEPASRLDLAGNALAAWLGAAALDDRSPALALLLLGAAPPPARLAEDGCHQFPAGGYTVWRERGLLVTWDHGPLGLGPLAAHGHADALAVTVHSANDVVVADPGTPAYYEDTEVRDRARGTPWHSTVSFAAGSQAEMLGPFLWGRRYTLRRHDEGYECRWWGGERHWRRVEVIGRRTQIEDRVHGPYPELSFLLHPDARAELAGAQALVTVGSTRARILGEGIEAWRLVPAESASRFAERRPTHRLAAAFRGPGCITRIEVEPA